MHERIRNMSAPVTPPRGMRDFLPEQKALRERILGSLREVFTRHGFESIETPVMEDIDYLHSGLGGENEKLSYSLLRRGLDLDQAQACIEGGDMLALCDLGLRFDLTVPLARFYASHRSELPPIFRSLQVAPVWRAERPQKGRYRQFMQCDVDIIGEPSSLAEAEVLIAAFDVLSHLGLGQCSIGINDRRILYGILEFCGFDREQWQSVLITLDKHDRIGVDSVLQELGAFGEDSVRALGDILEKFQRAEREGKTSLAVSSMSQILPNTIEPGVLEHLESLAQAVQGSLTKSVVIRFDPTLVRGMGYYTGTIFELYHPKSSISLGGGGRYDDMIGRFLAQSVPACGFSLGFERIIELLETESFADEHSVALLYDPNVPLDKLVSLKTDLIAQGKRVRLEKKTKNIKHILERMKASGCSQYAFVKSDVVSHADFAWKELY